MMDGVRLTDITLHRARARLVVDGLVEQVGDTYRLTEAGNAARYTACPSACSGVHAYRVVSILI